MKLSGLRPPEPFCDLTYEVAAGVARITLGRPAELNSFTARMYAELRASLRLAGVDTDIDVVVITGSGRAFATGGDLKELLGHYDSDNILGLHNFTDNSPFNTLRSCPKTVIAAVNGFCLAGGLIVASYCDIVIAAESATLGIPQARHGLSDKFIPACLWGRVPLAKLKYLIHTARLITAAEALECGMVTEVVPDEQLAARVDEVIAEVQSTSAAARADFKRYLDQLQPTVQPGIPEGLLTNPDLVDGLRRFADRSQPVRNGGR